MLLLLLLVVLSLLDETAIDVSIGGGGGEEGSVVLGRGDFECGRADREQLDGGYARQAHGSNSVVLQEARVKFLELVLRCSSQSATRCDEVERS